MICLFVLDDSLTSQRITTRTEQLTKCYEQLQTLRVWLATCTCKTSLILYIHRNIQRRHFYHGDA